MFCKGFPPVQPQRLAGRPPVWYGNRRLAGYAKKGCLSGEIPARTAHQIPRPLLPPAGPAQRAGVHPRSIGLEGDGRFYSFSFRGFTEETPDKLRRRGVTAGRCYRIPVTDGAYRLAEARLRAMSARRADYRYSYIGVALCLLRLPFHWKNRYFCSQFVAELLSASGAVPLRKAPSLYLPTIFRRSWTECAR